MAGMISVMFGDRLDGCSVDGSSSQVVLEYPWDTAGLVTAGDVVPCTGYLVYWMHGCVADCDIVGSRSRQALPAMSRANL